ncbi:hypothetical protein [Arthrobacter sp. NyZ413]|uniref:hypothetical protein n=1 Tax=Arthrobacter sp. NyZ413 TaxID=3144669 RepID=UPI003BF77605
MNDSAPAKDRCTIHVSDPADLDTQLSQAEAQLQHQASLYQDRGILITRHSPWDFTLELDPSVPFGTTRENPA